MAAHLTNPDGFIRTDDGRIFTSDGRTELGASWADTTSSYSTSTSGIESYHPIPHYSDSVTAPSMAMVARERAAEARRKAKEKRPEIKLISKQNPTIDDILEYSMSLEDNIEDYDLPF